MRILITETTWDAARTAKDLEDAGFRLTRAETAEDLDEFARYWQQDAALIAPGLPGSDAAAAIALVRRAAPRLPIVALVSPEADRTAREALYRAGADAVLELSLTGAELAGRLRAMVMRANGFSTPRAVIGRLELDTVMCAVCTGFAPACVPGEGLDGPRRLPLTRREYELVELLFLANGRAVSRAEVMDRLYGADEEPDMRILDVFVARIRAKMESAGIDPAMLQAPRGRGLRLKLPGPDVSGAHVAGAQGAEHGAAGAHAA